MGIAKDKNYVMRVDALTHRRNPWVMNSFTGVVAEYCTAAQAAASVYSLRKSHPAGRGLPLAPRFPGACLPQHPEGRPGPGPEGGAGHRQLQSAVAHRDRGGRGHRHPGFRRRPLCHRFPLAAGDCHGNPEGQARVFAGPRLARPQDHQQGHHRRHPAVAGGGRSAGLPGTESHGARAGGAGGDRAGQGEVAGETAAASGGSSRPSSRFPSGSCRPAGCSPATVQSCRSSRRTAPQSGSACCARPVWR